MKTTTILITTGILIVIAIFFAGALGNQSKKEEQIQNVSIVDGKQIITIKAKGGYRPKISNAKAGVPTIVRFQTSGTFDCSSSVRIPSMNISEVLPNSGLKDIDLGIPQVGTLEGSCGMGMYPFEINFQL